jgi:nitrogen fixation protein
MGISDFIKKKKLEEEVKRIKKEAEVAGNVRMQSLEVELGVSAEGMSGTYR